MKLTDKMKQAMEQLLELDGQQRDKILADIGRAALAQRIVAKAARKEGEPRKRIRTVEDHKIVRAFGAAPKPRKHDE